VAKVLVTYTTKYGSTTDVAEVIGEELRAAGATVDVRPIREAGDITGYDAVVVGGPMIVGWRREAVRFLAKNKQALSGKPVALFLMAMALTKTGDSKIGDTAVFQDPVGAKTPKSPGRLSIHEWFSTPSKHLGPVLKKVPAVKPVAAGFFGGKLDYSKLNPLELLFVRLVVRAKEGDTRNWEAIRSWTREVVPLLGVSRVQ
jgi:menaquinone-dependent protoporphyrinogen oxidase